MQKSELFPDSDLVREKLNDVVGAIREELDDHRQAINEGTQEVAATNEFLNEVTSRLDKLTERVDELTLLIKGAKGEKSFEIRPLSEKEKDVFSSLYLLTESQPYVTYEQIARHASLSKDLAITYITMMIQKGIPVLKKHQGSKVFVRLDDAFRQKQARENIVGLSAPLSRWF